MGLLFSVIVPALNEEAFIEKCLLSLSDQTAPRKKYEIIVSDSNSTDTTAEIAKTLADRVVSCRRHSAGFGRNFGTKHAKSGLFGFVDADTIASPTWIEGALASLQKNIAATGPIKSLEKDSLPIQLFYSWWSMQSHLSVLLGKPIFPGFNIAVRKISFQGVGGFSEKNFTCEDIDFSLKLKSIGRIGFSKKMLVETSGRRINETGYLTYVSNAWTHFLFNKSRTWQEHRKDFQ